MYFLSDKIEFPAIQLADENGLLAIGGDLSVDRLVHAYQNGIFPWYEEDQPILWWSPDPRFVLYPDKLKVSKSMKKILKNKEFKITQNKAFKDVVIQCSKVKRKGQSSTWITPEMINSYCKLQEQGWAKSVEVWKGDMLVGGLYGIDLKNGVFCGESMFSLIDNASKVGFITLVKQNQYQLIDCQIHTNHLESLGAEEIPRVEFLKFL
ncbi:leucyl/phenylalanyl-tRNA--protein transferase [Flavobacteriaceae sp. LMIT009]